MSLSDVHTMAEALRGIGAALTAPLDCLPEPVYVTVRLSDTAVRVGMLMNSENAVGTWAEEFGEPMRSDIVPGSDTVPGQHSISHNVTVNYTDEYGQDYNLNIFWIETK